MPKRKPHHSICIIANREEAGEYVDTLLSEYGDVEVENREWDVWGIDEVRELTREASRHNLSREGTVYRIRTNRITDPAQNALLKLFEEPPQDTYFLVLAPPGIHLISTLRSRMEIEEVSRGSLAGYARSWMDMPLADRIDRVSEYVQAPDEEVRTLFEEIRSILQERLREEDEKEKIVHSLRAVDTALLYTGDVSASRKQLLEMVALSL